MPMYNWVDHKNQKTIEVVRHFKDYEQPPTQDECDWDITDAKWERVISTVGVKKGWLWGGGKGNW